MQLFEGMNKLDAFDVLHKIEVLLFFAKSPITKEGIINIMNTEMDIGNDSVDDPLHFTILPNGSICELVEHNTYLHIYKKQRRGILKYIFFDLYYFKTKHAPLELLKLNKRNLLQQLENTPEEKRIKQFLQKNYAYKKDNITKRLLILDV